MNIIVTGATRGLGLEISKRLLAKGHTLYAVSRKRNDDFDALVALFPNNLNFIPHNLSDIKGIKEAIFAKLVEDKVVIHGYVNNAAISYDDLLTNLNIDKLQEMINVNQIAPMVMTKYVIRNMLLHQTKGCIVHISSISAHTGFKGLSMYASTKGALEAYSKNTAREWGSLGIRSNCVVCGFMETDMTNMMTEDQKSKIHKRAALKEATDLGSVSDTVSFLLGDESKSITGQHIFVDGGVI